MTLSQFDLGWISVEPLKLWTSPFNGFLNGSGLKTLLLPRDMSKSTNIETPHLRLI